MEVLFVLIWLMVMSFMDIKACKVPAWILGMGVGFTIMIAIGRCVFGREAYYILLCGMIPGILLLVLALLTRMVGYGDGVVLICLGALDGGKVGVIALLIGLGMAAVFSLVLLTLGKVKRNTQIPFLPFLSMGWILTTGIK